MLTISGSGDMSSYSSVSAPPWEEYRDGIVSVVLEEGVRSIGSYAFAYHENLRTLYLPSTLEAIYGNAFYNCDDLQEVHIGTLSDWLDIEFSSGMYCTPLSCGADLFIGGEPLGSAVIPAGAYLMINSFAYCYSLYEIVLSEPDLSLDPYAFYDCWGLERVVFPGTEAEAAALKAEIRDTCGDGNERLLEAEWVCLEPISEISPRQSYLILTPGESYDLSLEIENEAYRSRANWFVTDADGKFDLYSEVLEVDSDTGTVTALQAGNAGVVAYMYVDDVPLCAKFRIDVAGAPAAAEISQITTTGSKATVKLYSLDYAGIPILPVLAQNVDPSASVLIPQGDLPEAAQTAAVTSARFLDEKAAELFELVPEGDRMLRIVPKYSALELAQASSKNIKDTYKSKIEITVGEGEQAQTYVLMKGASEATYTLTVKQAKPSVKATAGKINSLIPDHETAIKLKGTKVTAIELNPDKASSADIFVDTEQRTVRLAEGSTLTKGTRNVYLLATVEGWAVKVPVTLKVTVAATKPTVKLSKTTLTVYADSLDNADTKVTITPAAYRDDGNFALRVKNVIRDGEDLGTSSDLTLIFSDGRIYVAPYGISEPDKAHTYKIKIGLCDKWNPDHVLKTVTLTVKTKPVSSKITLDLKVTGAIDLTVPGSPVKIKRPSRTIPAIRYTGA